MATTDVFGALANPVRRKILEMLLDAPRAAGDIADEFELNRSAVSEHLQVLRLAGLVREEVKGRNRIYHLTPLPLQEAATWLHPFEHYWRRRLRALKDVLNKEQE